jgi:phosphatidylinositol kinase/protein kinase (PI-3  family)
MLTVKSTRLGDRHGENLSFEEGTGGILHVDFNCLFDKVRALLPIIF